MASRLRAVSLLSSVALMVGASPATANRTALISVSSAERQANNSSENCLPSRNGRYVAFLSYASTLAPKDGNDQPDVFRRDRVTGVAALVSGGRDVLVGDEGNDRLRGDFGGVGGNAPAVFSGGADRFVFVNGSGLDTIFDCQDEIDLIDLRFFLGIDGFGEVDAQAAQVGADTVIDLGAAAGGPPAINVLTLAGFLVTDLSQTDFLFG